MAGASKGWRVRVAALSQLGSTRAYNEDTVALFVPGDAEVRVPGLRWPAGRSESLTSATGLGLLVLDGIDGEMAGDVACRPVLDSLGAAFTEGVPTTSRRRGQWLAEALRSASAQARERRSFHAGQGATMALVVIHGGTIHMVHVGDVRVYRLRDGELELRTRDDTLRNHARDHGVEEALINELPQRVLTQTLGYGEPNPHLQQFAAAEDDVLLLCSDGLYEFITPAAMTTTLNGRDPAEACARLVALAARNGAHDNITALVARIELDP